METNQPDQSIDEPNPKRPKIESAGSTSSKPESKDPFLTMPPDILVKIIAYTPIAQWSTLELVDKNFRVATQIAYRQLRNLNLVRDFTIESENEGSESSIAKSVKWNLQKLVERSPFLTSLGGIHPGADAAPALAQFEHLQSISLGDAGFFTSHGGIPLGNVIAFVEATRSRSSLKELRLYNVVQRQGRRVTTNFDRFATSFASGRHIRSPLKLEKFSFASNGHLLRIRLDTLDATRLTDVRLEKACVEPQQLTNLIERASELRRMELSFLCCSNRNYNGPRLQANTKLLVALSSRENLTALKFDSINYINCSCMNFIPEFIQMLKDIGRRGQLRKLALEKRLFYYSTANEKDEMCSTISIFFPNLQSIKLHTSGISDGSIFNIVSLADLEEIDLNTDGTPVSANNIKKIAQLSRLKRLALPRLRQGEDPNSYKYLADITTLKDLRIGNASVIDADIWKKISDGLAANLECLMVRGVNNENGVIQLLEKAVCLRVLILMGNITDRSLMVIAKSCPNLETLGVKSDLYPNGISIRGLQEVGNRCSKLNRLGGFSSAGINSLQLAKYRKIVDDVDVDFWKYDFDDVYD